MRLKRRFYVKAAWKGTEVSISDPAFFSYAEKGWVRDRTFYDEPMIRSVNPMFTWTDNHTFNLWQPVDKDHLFLPYNCKFTKYSPNCASAIRNGIGAGDIDWVYHPYLGRATLPLMRHWSNQRLHGSSSTFATKTIPADGLSIKSAVTHVLASSSYKYWNELGS